MDTLPQALSNIIRDSGLSFKESQVSYILTCPKCDKPKKLYIRKSDGKFTCWSCSQSEGFYGRAEFALAVLLDRPAESFRAALYGEGEVNLTEYWSPEITNFYDNDEEQPAASLHLEQLAWPADFYDISDIRSVKGLEYLATRGIDENLATRYGIKYCEYFKRVYFPLELNGVLYGWQGRSLNPLDKMKILSSNNIPRSSQLMFSNRLEGSEHAVLTEGPIDAIKADLCKGNVCSMGKAITPVQFGSLLNAGIKEIYLALDPDAISEAERLMANYHGQAKFYAMFAPSRYKDIGEMEPEAVLELKNTATLMNPSLIYVYIKKPTF